MVVVDVINDLIRTEKAAVIMQHQEIGGVLGIQGALGACNHESKDTRSGPKSLLEHGLEGALHSAGFTEVKLISSGPDLPELYRAERLGVHISRQLGLELSGLSVVGYPFNTLLPHEEGRYSLDAPVLMPEKKVVVDRRDVKVVNVGGGKLKSAEMSQAIFDINMLQVINTYDYLQCLGAIANGKFIAHFSATNDGDIAPVAAIAHYMHLAGLNVGLVSFDAHGDYNTCETSPSMNLHGMHNAIATLDHMKQSYLARLGSLDYEKPERKINPEHMLHVGGRAFDPLEQRLMEEDGVNIFTMEDIKRAQARHTLAQHFAGLYAQAMKDADAVIVCIDYDVLNPELEGLKNGKLAVYSPEKNGLQPVDLKTMLRIIARNGKPIVGLLGSELTPNDKDGHSYRLAVDIVGDFLSNLRYGPR